MKLVQIRGQRGAVCNRILAALPEWFGRPAARAAYVAHAENAPMFGVSRDGAVIGYLSLADHFGTNCEIHSMGVLPEFHRQGAGRVLVNAALSRARENGFQFMSVKTLSASQPDPNYARTRAFYGAMGFRSFEEFPTLWGNQAPCVMLVRATS